MIELRHLKKQYENATPLKDVNAVIRDGDVISVIGPSGFRHYVYHLYLM